jgi:galactose mutarotase-like enzyme
MNTSVLDAGPILAARDIRKSYGRGAARFDAPADVSTSRAVRSRRSPVSAGGNHIGPCHRRLDAGPSAAQVLPVSAERLLPTEITDVDKFASGLLDFREPRRIGPTAINHAFTAMRSDVDARRRVRLTDGGGHGVEISMGESCQWVQVYTADAAGSTGQRDGLAVEPMTCPPNALNSQRDLLIIEPGGSVSAEWRIGAI